jgi:RNA polymerase sigma-70 factor (ECF subfamily)
MMGPMQDRVLVWRAKRGSKQAFDQIYQGYLDALLTVAISLLGNAHEAEEVVQEVFVTFAESLDRFELRGSLKAFLATCVANRARDLLRQRSRRDRTDAERVPGPLPDAGPLDLVIRSEQMQRLRGALAQLPYEQQEVILLRIHGGLTFRALARALAAPLGTVQARYRYGLDKLRILMDSEVVE